jgi:hypothetical protein
MMSFVEPMCRSGFYFNNIRTLALKNVVLEKPTGDPVIKLNIDNEETI